MADLPTVLTAAGLTPQSPAELRAALLALVSATNPGYTANLPGALIEDIASTDVGAMVIIDQARVEAVNSLTPFGANPFILKQLGEVYGVALGQASNTSVQLVFSGPPGFVVAQGFIITDGTYQYVVQDGGIIATDGETSLLSAVADQSGSWAVPAGTVTQLVTSVPSTIILTVTNPNAGVPGTGTETETSYRSRVLQAGLAASQGMSRYLKTYLGNVEGVQPRLIAAQQQTGGGWVIIVGGGDNYEVAYGIFYSLFDIASLVGSTMSITDITEALPGVVTTLLNHGYSAGQAIEIAGVDPVTMDADEADEIVVLEVLTNKTFKLGKLFAGQEILTITWSGDEVTVETTTNHGITVGSTFTIQGCVPTEYNGTFVALTGTATDQLVYALVGDPGADTVQGQVLAGTALYDTTALGPYVDGGVLTPNFRNVEVTITDFPDTYVIRFVNPPRQVVTMTVTWNTTSPNFVAPAAVAQLGAPAIADYVNSIYVGQPMNLFRLEDAFQAGVASVLPADLLTRMVFAVSIDGVGVVPSSGTGIIAGDPESYFFATASGISIVQG